MRWLEVSVEVEAEIAEAVADILGRFGHAGTAISSPSGPLPAATLTVHSYLPEDDRAPASEQRIREALWHLGQIRPVPEPTFRRIEEDDWAEAWKKHYRPLEIGRRLIVIPAWESLDPGRRLPIYLDPGMAFGTGAHPSTRLCLLALERSVRPGDLVVDLGCGSGVLSVAAARLGAGRVLACDTDMVAVRATELSSARNQVQEAVEVFPGSLGETKDRLGRLGRLADVIVSNILAPVLIDLLRTGLARAARAHGTVILSGILADQEGEVGHAARQAGLAAVGAEREQDWSALVYRNESAAP